ncbi:MAG TPA: adenine deaminase C-terminal domain-containing protein [Anaerolineae bacterium]|jgi:adenine deaminase|nr:adenine deaminase C-terminal domain-containing protein [Anaerolineae bacterium]
MTEHRKVSLDGTKTLVKVALGQHPADLYIRDGRLVNVYSGEILEGQGVAISGGRIAYVGPSIDGVGEATETIDVSGAYLVPGLVDPHAHVDFFANPLSLAPHLLAGGTTAVMADPHEVVGALGLPGLEALVSMTRGLPLKYYFSVPVATPPLPEAEGRPVLDEQEVESLLVRPEMRAIAEVTPWVRVVTCDEDLLAKFAIAQRHEQRIEGHTTGASFQKLNALVAAGLTSCHEAINAREARDRLRLGLYVMLRHGSIRRDLDSLAGMLVGDNAVDSSRVMLTPDWMDPPTILRQGYMESLVRETIDRGVDPVVAIQMASVNPASYLGLGSQIGGIAPGRFADIAVVDDLRRMRPRLVVAEGKVVAQEGEYVGEELSLPKEAMGLPWLPHRVLPPELHPTDFEVLGPCSDGTITVPTIHIVDRTITERRDVQLSVEGGRVRLPRDGDVLKIALLNTELPGFRTAFLTGFGAPVGGLASSLAHEPHRPMVIGRSESDMVLALSRMRDLGGGLVLAHGGEVKSEIPLPMGGLMSDEPLGELAAQIAKMNRLLQKMGCSLENPVFTIGFLTFSMLPWIRLTPDGVRDVKSGQIIWPASAS